MKRLLLSPGLLPVSVLALQALALAALLLGADLAYGDPPGRLPHALERPLALLVLGLAGPAALLASALGLHRLHRARAPLPATLATLPYLVPLVPAAVCAWGFWFLL